MPERPHAVLVPRRCSSQPRRISARHARVGCNPIEAITYDVTIAVAALIAALAGNLLPLRSRDHCPVGDARAGRCTRGARHRGADVHSAGSGDGHSGRPGILQVASTDVRLTDRVVLSQRQASRSTAWSPRAKRPSTSRWSRRIHSRAQRSERRYSAPFSITGPSD